VLSLLRRLGRISSLQLYLLDGGLKASSKERLLRLCSDSCVRVKWLDPDLSLLDGLPVSGHVTRTAYARLLLPSLLPQNLSKVIYLDSDLLICRDITALWAEPFEGAACLAITDSAAPWIDAEVAAPTFKRFQSHLAAARPIPNYREIGLDPRARYFNSGVLSIDLAAWRAQAIVPQALECLEKHRENVLWWDQYALNVVLHGRWRPLDVRWNQGSHVFHYPSADECPFDKATWRMARNDPWIVHFTSHVKPWHFGCPHPYRRRFFKTVDRSPWRGWRPQKPYDGFSGWLNYEYQRYRQWRRDRRTKRKQLRSASRRAA
jgi:lipopolysaccharide biosynthesis glycosyltransferase